VREYSEAFPHKERSPPRCPLPRRHKKTNKKSKIEENTFITGQLTLRR
jgi:hypothetical protein